MGKLHLMLLPVYFKMETEWLPYKTNTDQFYENVENNIVESERLLKTMPSKQHLDFNR